MKDQEEADEDRQLALYSVWVKNKFKDAKSVKLIWHMLAFNKDAVSERTEEQLENLQADVCEIIKKIENATEFPRKQTGLCDYCVYKSICPSFKHEADLEKIEDIEEFKKDEGVQLVDEYSEIKIKLGELKKQEEQMKNKLIAYTKQFGVDVVYGSNKRCSIKEFNKIVLPANKDKLIKLLKEKELWDKYSMLCSVRLNSHIVKGEIKDEDICGCVEGVKDFRLSLKERDKIEGNRL